MPRIDAIRSERARLFGTRVGEDELPHCGAIEVTSAQGASRSFFVQAQHLAMADLLGDQALAALGTYTDRATAKAKIETISEGNSDNLSESREAAAS